MGAQSIPQASQRDNEDYTGHQLMHAKKAPRSARPEREPACRWEGLVMVLIGLFTAYWCVYPAWLLLQVGKPETYLGRWEMIGIGFTPVALGYGLLYLFGGRWAVTTLGPLHKPSGWGNAVGLVLTLIGLALFAGIGYALKTGR
jgi:hypothetical protein